MKIEISPEELRLIEPIIRNEARKMHNLWGRAYVPEGPFEQEITARYLTEAAQLEELADRLAEQPHAL